jgi:CBS domain-containing protein
VAGGAIEDAECRSYARSDAKPLRDVMSRDLLTVAPGDTLGEAAEKMTGRGVGAALVMDFGRLLGILTERDLLAAVAGRVQTGKARVREWMTENPVTVPEATPIGRAASIMVTDGFRHLPIVDGERAYPEYENDAEGDGE